MEFLTGSGDGSQADGKVTLVGSVQRQLNDDDVTVDVEVVECAVHVGKCSRVDVGRTSDENLVDTLAPQKQADGSMGWALPLDPSVRVIHLGDINELGNIVAGAFANPHEAGKGEYLPLVGEFTSFNEIVETLNRQGYNFSYKQVPKESFAGSFPGATEIVATFDYWEAHTYLGSDSSDQIALANRIAGRQPTNSSTWARLNLPAAIEDYQRGRVGAI